MVRNRSLASESGLSRGSSTDLEQEKLVVKGNTNMRLYRDSRMDTVYRYDRKILTL